MCHTLFENMDYALVGLDLVGINGADGRALEHSDNTGACLDGFLVKNYT